MEPDVRCRCGADEHSEVGSLETAGEDDNEPRAPVRIAANTHSYSLLNDPNTGSPANVEASNLYKDNRKEYTKRVRETVEKSWEE